MTRTTKHFVAATLGLVLGASACNNDELFRPANFTPINPLFARYVSMGNSITAGYQSGGINDSTQKQAYPVLLANAMGSPFFSPLMNRPGCAPPYTNVFTGARVTPAGFPPSTSTSCYLRKTQAVPPPYISNTAVPGADVLSPYNNLDTAAHSNTLTTFFLGGLTQIQMVEKAQPTFVSVWIGNNDVLGAATDGANAGDSTKITPVATFQSRYTALLDSLQAVNPKGAMLMGVAKVTAIPFFSRGSTYLGAKLANQLPPAMTVTASCAPPRGDSVLVPFPFGAALVGAAAAGSPTTLDCTEAQTVQPAELVKLLTTIAAYNTFISAQAASHGWGYFDPNPTLDSLATVATAVRPFPLIGQACSVNPFGTAFSCDAVHPSAATQKLIANKLAQTINAKYGTSIPRIP
jgi:lysophospholipase L1-like esterase